jgi:CheY-like chemotaxis protein
VGVAARILVVEDNELIRAEVATILSLEGFEVVEAENGRDGLRRLAEERPDLILSDLMMPEMDGFAFLEAARANTLWASIPFVMLSARADKDAAEQALALGARRYLTKPVDVEALLAIVAHALRGDGESSGNG